MTNKPELASPDGAVRSRLDLVTKIVLVLLAVCAGLAFVAFIAGLDQRSLLHRLESRPYDVLWSEARASDDRADALNSLWLALLIATGAAFVTWTYVQYRRLDDVRDEKRYRDWWAIGGWLIPIATLFVPVRIVRDIWKATVERAKEQDRVRTGEPASSAFPIVGVWWGLWLAMNFVALSANGEGTTPAELLAQNTVLLVRNVVAIAAAVMAIAVVYRIGRAERGLAEATDRNVDESVRSGL